MSGLHVGRQDLDRDAIAGVVADITHMPADQVAGYVVIAVPRDGETGMSTDLCRPAAVSILARLAAAIAASLPCGEHS